MSEPTARPWHVQHGTNIMAGRDCLGTFGGRQASHEPDRTRIADENLANAALVVRAVNNHAALLRELRHLVRLLEPLESDGRLDIPGLATLNGARKAIAEATSSE